MGGVSDARRDVRLTTDEVALVLRRAAELEALAEGPAAGLDDRYDADAVEAAATEVGLSPDAVRQAVAELRVGSLAQPPEPPRRRLAAVTAAGSPLVAEQRVVAVEPRTALAVLDGLMRQQLFEPRRREDGGRTTYRPRFDLAAKLRRKLDFTGSLKLDEVVSVTTTASPSGDGSLVRIEAQLATSRSTVVGGSAAAGAATTLVTGVGGALLAEPALVVLSFPAGAAIGAGALRVRGRRWDQVRRDVNDALTLLLDRV